jgi:hypothetical protein
MGFLEDRHNRLLQQQEVMKAPTVAGAIDDIEQYKTEEAIPTEEPNTKRSFLLERHEKIGGKEEAKAVQATKKASANSAIKEAAVRFARDRLGEKDITEEEAMEEFMAHFRSFNVNELTAAGDFNYVSAAAADATKREDEKAAQRLSDYRLLYQAFNEMPAFSDGVGTATLDYISGIAKAPSTYVGLALPGIGKGAGIAATQAAKEGVKLTLKEAFKKPFTTVIQQAAARPLATTMGVEAGAGALQNIAAQKTELAADLREDYSLGETAFVGTLSGLATPAALLPGAVKGFVARKAEAKTGDLVGEAKASVLKANEKALERTQKVLENNSELAEAIKAAMPSLDPEDVLKVSKKKKPLDPEQVVSGKKISQAEAEELGLADWQRIAPSKDQVSRIFGAVTDIMVQAKIAPKPGERISEAVARVVREADLGKSVAPEIMEKYNITSDDLANLLMADASDAASELAARGAKAKVFKNLQEVAANDIFALSKERKKVLDKLDNQLREGDARGALETTQQVDTDTFIRKLDQVRLASMTSQTATTIRNTASGVTRVGIDVVMKSFDRGVASAAKKLGGGKGTVSLGTAVPNRDISAVVFGVLNKKESTAITEIFEMGFHNKATQLFKQLRDLDDATGAKGVKMTKMRHYSQELNALNTLSDNIFKRASFVGSLKRQLNEKYARDLLDVERLRAAGKQADDLILSDYDLVEIIRQGKFNDTFAGKENGKMLDDAVNNALEFTYQRTPENDTLKLMINAMHKVPFVTTSLVPFPRFVANAMTFTYEYSPLYLLGKNKQGNRVITELVGKGNEENYEATAKALTGLSLYTGAYAFRSSENAGENWWEYKFDDGSTFDMRPFFPAAPFLFFAEMARRSLNDDPVMGDRSFITDAIQALSGTQFRAGFGIYALDSALKDLDGVSLFDDEVSASVKGDKLAKIGINFFANVVNTFTIPLTFGQDMYNTFLAPDDERIVRQMDVSDDLLSLTINKSLARIPMNFALEEMLAESIGTKAPEIYEMPTRDAPLRRVTPITRQTFGILQQERRNFFEDELARLKLNRSILTSKTGVPEADQLIGSLMGEYVSDFIVPVLKNSEEYKDMDSDSQKDFIRSVIKEYKNDVMDVVKLRSSLSGKERYGFDPMQRVAFNKLGPTAQKRALTRYHEVFGNPQEGEPYDYEQLVEYGKFYQKLGVR